MREILLQICLLTVFSSSTGTYDVGGKANMISAEGQSRNLEELSTAEQKDVRGLGKFTQEDPFPINAKHQTPASGGSIKIGQKQESNDSTTRKTNGSILVDYKYQVPENEDRLANNYMTYGFKNEVPEIEGNKPDDSIAISSKRKGPNFALFLRIDNEEKESKDNKDHKPEVYTPNNFKLAVPVDEFHASAAMISLGLECQVPNNEVYSKPVNPKCRIRESEDSIVTADKHEFNDKGDIYIPRASISVDSKSEFPKNEVHITDNSTPLNLVYQTHETERSVKTDDKFESSNNMPDLSVLLNSMSVVSQNKGISAGTMSLDHELEYNKIKGVMPKSPSTISKPENPSANFLKLYTSSSSNEGDIIKRRGVIPFLSFRQLYQKMPIPSVSLQTTNLEMPKQYRTRRATNNKNTIPIMLLETPNPEIARPSLSFRHYPTISKPRMLHQINNHKLSMSSKSSRSSMSSYQSKKLKNTGPFMSMQTTNPQISKHYMTWQTSDQQNTIPSMAFQSTNTENAMSSMSLQTTDHKNTIPSMNLHITYPQISKESKLLTDWQTTNHENTIPSVALETTNTENAMSSLSLATTDHEHTIPSMNTNLQISKEWQTNNHENTIPSMNNHLQISKEWQTNNHENTIPSMALETTNTNTENSMSSLSLATSNHENAMPSVVLETTNTENTMPSMSSQITYHENAIPVRQTINLENMIPPPQLKTAGTEISKHILSTQSTNSKYTIPSIPWETTNIENMVPHMPLHTPSNIISKHIQTLKSTNPEYAAHSMSSHATYQKNTIPSMPLQSTNTEFSKHSMSLKNTDLENTIPSMSIQTTIHENTKIPSLSSWETNNLDRRMPSNTLQTSSDIISKHTQTIKSTNPVYATDSISLHTSNFKNKIPTMSLHPAIHQISEQSQAQQTTNIEKTIPTMPLHPTNTQISKQSQLWQTSNLKNALHTMSLNPTNLQISKKSQLWQATNLENAIHTMSLQRSNPQISKQSQSLQQTSNLHSAIPQKALQIASSSDSGSSISNSRSGSVSSSSSSSRSSSSSSSSSSVTKISKRKLMPYKYRLLIPSGQNVVTKN